MLSLPLTIVSLVALLPIRFTICGDPLIWASVEAKAMFNANTMPGNGPGDECSLPNTFQMRANGSWLPSSEYDLNGYFDKHCGIYLHLTIPEDEPEEGAECRSKMKELNKEKEELKEQDDKLSKEKKEHEFNLEKLRNETELLNTLKNKLKDIEVEQKALKMEIRLSTIKLNVKKDIELHKKIYYMLENKTCSEAAPHDIEMMAKTYKGTLKYVCEQEQ